MIGRAALLWASLLAAPSAHADQAACAALHAATPDKIASFTLQDRRAYEDPAAGFAAQYETSEGARLSVFHYLGGLETARAEDIPALMRAEMGRVVAYYSARGLNLTPAFRIKLSQTGNPAAAEQGFRQADGIRDVTVLGAAEGCLVKLRYTGHALERDRLLRLWRMASTR